MGDVGDDFRGYKSERQNKKRENRENSANWLENEGIKFESKNGGAHLIVDNPHTGVKIDFWPGTGLYHERGGKQGRGIKNLLGYIRRCANV